MSYTYFSSPESEPFHLCVLEDGSPFGRRLVSELTKVPWLTLQTTEQGSTELVFLIGDPASVHAVLTTRTSLTKVWVYLLQRYEGLDPRHVEVLNAKADRIFSTNREWRTIQRQQGLVRPLDVLHAGIRVAGPRTAGVRTEGPRTATASPRTEGRLSLGIPEEVFLILSTHRNASHKRYDTLIQAFVDLLIKHPQKPLFLMCVCAKGQDAEGYHAIFDLFAQALRQKGVEVSDYSNRLLLSARYDSLTDDELGVFYDIADCGVSCADGGAVGLSVLESMAHGLPSVVSNTVAHRDICTADNSIRVDPVVRLVEDSSTQRQLVSATAVAQALETYVLHEPLRKAHAAAAAAAAAPYSESAVLTGLVKRIDLLRRERDIDSER